MDCIALHLYLYLYFYLYLSLYLSLVFCKLEQFLQTANNVGRMNLDGGRQKEYIAHIWTVCINTYIHVQFIHIQCIHMHTCAMHTHTMYIHAYMCNSASITFGFGTVNIWTLCCATESTILGHCLQFNFIAVHYAHSSATEHLHRVQMQQNTFQSNAIFVESSTVLFNTKQWNRMKWKRVYHIRAFQHFSGIECNGLHMQCMAQHFSAFRVESTIMQRAVRRAWQNI